MKKSWKDYWNDAAQKERQRYEQMSVEAMLKNIKKGKYGVYYVIWEILCKKANLRQVTQVLLEVLENEADELIRLNCAREFIKLIPNCPFKYVDVGGTHPEVKGNLKELRKLLGKSLNALD